MQEAGTALHLARSGRLIIKASSQVREGTLLVDGEGRRTGKVMEIIGPVLSPYLSVQPMTDRIERLIGSKVFTSDAPERSERESFRSQYKSNKGRRGGGTDRRRNQRSEPYDIRGTQHQKMRNS